MKTRKEATSYLAYLAEDKDGSMWKAKNGAAHIGFVELRLLFDYVYEGKPESPDEYIVGIRYE